MKTPTQELVIWLIAAICLVLGIVVAPIADGNTLLPLIIGVALGVMAHDLRRRRLAGDSQ